MLIDTGLEILDEQECRALLAAHSIGRVAVSIGALPAVFPVNYQVSAGEIVFRTDDGTKFAAAVHNSVVAFEVDEADAIYHEGWSVLVIGTAAVVDTARHADVSVRPWAPGRRHHLVAIAIEMISGRRIRHDIPLEEDAGPAGAP